MNAAVRDAANIWMNDSDQPTLDYGQPPTRGTMRRRLATNLAIAGLVVVAALIAAMWVIALARGDVRRLSEFMDTPPEFRGNHGPWRRSPVLRGLYEYALLCTVVGVLPVACIGAAVEGTRRAWIVVALAAAVLVVSCAHFPLFD